jgi:DNA-binding response OmpR family regulator
VIEPAARTRRHENADPFTKTVQVTIGRLRRKLGDPNVIDTIRGVGYRIDSPR